MKSSVEKRVREKMGLPPRLVQSLFIISIVIMILSVGVFFSIAKVEDVTFKPDSYSQFSKAWHLNGSSESFSFPTRLSWDDKGAVVLSCTVPDTVSSGNSLFYSCSYCAQEVYIDDELIWSYAASKVLPFGEMRGSAYALVPMDESYAGKTLTIVMTSPYDATSTDYTGIYYGNTGNFKFALLEKSLWRIMIFVVLCTMSVFALVLGVYHIIKSVGDINSALIYFALLAFCVGGWIFVDPSVVQFFTSKIVVTQYCAFSLLLGCGTFYSGLSSCIFDKQRRFFQVTEVLGYSLYLLMLLLYVTNITDPVGFMYMVYGYAAYCLISTFIVLIIHYREYSDAKPMMLGTVCLIIGIGITVIVFLVNPMKADGVYSFAIAYTIYICIIFVMMINKEVDLVRVSTQVSTFKNLAYMDHLTRIPNRAAYDKDIDQLENDTDHKNEVTLIIGDLNYLKYTNDTYGHDVGDELIRAAARSIESCFEGVGTYYRLGGDEFAILLVNSAKPVVDHLERLQDIVDQYNRESDIELSFALGHASCVLPQEDSTKANLFREADKKMYDNKIRMHMARI